MRHQSPFRFDSSVGRLSSTCAVACLALALGAPGRAAAEPAVSGVCPDGSMFVVARREDAPCPRAKFVPASELPPLKPQYLPRPYTWYLEQEEQSETNPYNLVDKARELRALRDGRDPSSAARPPAPTTPPESARMSASPSPAPVASDAATLPLEPDELTDLVQLITLQQAVAPATLRVEDAAGGLVASLKLAYSPAFEQRVRSLLGLEGRERVLAFSVRSEQATEVYPRFFVTQDGASFRPDADRRQELGFVLGAPGAMDPGLLSAGYVALPSRFDPARPLTFWWNDRRLDVTLAP